MSIGGAAFAGAAASSVEAMALSLEAPASP
jgi:hypothetical protein